MTIHRWLVGSTVSSFSKANAGSQWSADVFVPVQCTDDGAVKVISTGYPNSNTMVVDGGEWLGSEIQVKLLATLK